jgi:hypothetical protein
MKQKPRSLSDVGSGRTGGHRERPRIGSDRITGNPEVCQDGLSTTLPRKSDSGRSPLICSKPVSQAESDSITLRFCRFEGVADRGRYAGVDIDHSNETGASVALGYEPAPLRAVAHLDSYP